MISVYQFLADHPGLELVQPSNSLFQRDRHYKLVLPTKDNTSKQLYFRFHHQRAAQPTGEAILASLAERMRTVVMHKECPNWLAAEVFTEWRLQHCELEALAGLSFIEELLTVEPLCHG